MIELRDYVIKFDHTAIGVPNIQDALPLYRDLLGGKEVGSGFVPQKGFQALQLEYPNGSKIELIAPAGENSFMHKFLRERGPGVHHLTFIVKNLEECVAHLRGLGYRVVDEDYSNPGWREAFVSPLSANGTIVQLAESDRYQ